MSKISNTMVVVLQYETIAKLLLEMKIKKCNMRINIDRNVICF